jgi:hypothetical protein
VLTPVLTRVNHPATTTTVRMTAMAWSASAIFVQALLNPLMASAWSTTEPTTYGSNGLSADTIKVALFNNSVTPDKAAAVASTGYNTGTWTTGNAVDGGGSPWWRDGVHRESVLHQHRFRWHQRPVV